MKEATLDDDDFLKVDSLADDFPTYGVQDNTVKVDELNKNQHFEKSEKKRESKKKSTIKEEIKTETLSRYHSFEQIEKELKILDLERKIAWEELISIKNDLKEDLAPSNFVEPAIKTVGLVGGLFLLRKLIFGK